MLNVDDKTIMTNNNTNNINQIIEITPRVFSIRNYEYDKLQSEKITIKNLMKFSIVLNIRPSDNKKIVLSEKLLKLTPNQTQTIDAYIKISNNKHRKNSQSSLDNLDSLYIHFSNDLIDLKYTLNIQFLTVNRSTTEKINNQEDLPEPQKNKNRSCDNFPNIEDINFDFSDSFQYNMNDYNRKNKTRNEKLQLDIPKFSYDTINSLKLINTLTFDRNIELTLVPSSSMLYNENRTLKEKLERLIKSLKEMEKLVESYSQLNTTTFKHLYIDSNDNFSINKDYYYDNNGTDNRYNINTPTIPRETDSNIYYNKNNNEIISPIRTSIEDRLGLNYHYNSNAEYNYNYNINRDVSTYTDNAEVYSRCAGVNDMRSYNTGNRYSFKANNNESVLDIDYHSRINIELKGHNYLTYLNDNDKLTLLNIDYDEIDDNIVNSIKERFIELQYNNFLENKKRFGSVIIILDTLVKYFDIGGGNKESTLSHSRKGSNIVNDYDISTLSIEKDRSLKKLEDLIKKFINKTSNILQSQYNETEILKRLSTITQDPLLSNEELDIIYKEIQNIESHSNELINLKLENKKVLIENKVLKNELNNINNSVEEYIHKMKVLEDDINLFRREIVQKDEKNKNKDKVISELENEIQYLKNKHNEHGYYDEAVRDNDNIRITNSSKQYEEGCNYIPNPTDNDYDMNNLYKLLSEKDDQLIDLQSQLHIKEEIIKKLKIMIGRNNSNDINSSQNVSSYEVEPNSFHNIRSNLNTVDSNYYKKENQNTINELKIKLSNFEREINKQKANNLTLHVENTNLKNIVL